MKFTADKVKGNIFANKDGLRKVSSVHANLSWQLLLKTHLSADLLAWERDNDSYIFVNQAIKHQKSTLASYQTSNNL